MQVTCSSASAICIASKLLQKLPPAGELLRPKPSAGPSNCVAPERSNLARRADVVHNRPRRLISPSNWAVQVGVRDASTSGMSRRTSVGVAAARLLLRPVSVLRVAAAQVRDGAASCGRLMGSSANSAVPESTM